MEKPGVKNSYQQFIYQVNPALKFENQKSAFLVLKSFS